MITMDLILEEEIKQYMKEQDLRPGSRLPGERYLGEYFGVQRLTLRASLQRLKNEGILYVKKNSGYYAAEPRVHITLGPLDSRFDTRQTQSCCTQLLNVLETEFEAPLMSKFPFSDPAGYTVLGLQTQNFVPYGIIKSLVPAACIPVLTPLVLRNQSLFDIYRTHGQDIVMCQEHIGCHRASETESILLGISPDASMVSHSIYGYNNKEQCILIQKITYIQDRVEFGGW